MPIRLMHSGSGARRALRGLVVVSAPVLAFLWLSGCAVRPSGGPRVASDLHDWSVVMQLAPGSTVRVEERTRTDKPRRLVRADDREVTIANGPAPRAVLRADVQRLFVVERLTAAKAKRGWLFGTIAGGLVGGLFTKSNRLPWALFLSTGWGAFGAGIGASDGFFDRKESLVYEAKSVAQSASLNQPADIGVQPAPAGTEMIAPEYLAARFTAAPDASSIATVAGHDEPGTRLIVTGRTLTGRKPVAGVSLFVFHADVRGQYATDTTDLNAAELNPRLHAAMRTDSHGRYQFDTIRPGSYDNGPAHVHYVVKAEGYKPLLIALQFEDDPIVIGRRKFGIPLLEPESFKLGPCKSRPDCVLTRPVVRDAQGISRVTRDIQLVRK